MLLLLQEDGSWKCKHGDEECAGDLQQLCVQQYSKDYNRYCALTNQLSWRCMCTHLHTCSKISASVVMLWPPLVAASRRNTNAQAAVPPCPFLSSRPSLCSLPAATSVAGAGDADVHVRVAAAAAAVVQVQLAHELYPVQQQGWPGPDRLLCDSHQVPQGKTEAADGSRQQCPSTAGKAGQVAGQLHAAGAEAAEQRGLRPHVGGWQAHAALPA